MKYNQQLKINVGFYRLFPNYESGMLLRDRVFHPDCLYYHIIFHITFHTYNQSFVTILGLNKQATISLIDDTHIIYHLYFNVNRNKLNN